MVSMFTPRGSVVSVSQNHTGRCVQGLSARNDDLLSFLQSIENLYFLRAHSTETNGPALGHAVFDYIDEAAAILLVEGTVVDHQHVVTPVDENTYRQALILSQSHWPLVSKAQPRNHFAIDDLR